MFEWSLKQSGVFWWLLFLTIQQVERVFLLPEVMAVEVPSTGVFVKTLTTGFSADLITSSIALLVVSVLTGMGGTLWWAWARWRRGSRQDERVSLGLVVTGIRGEPMRTKIIARETAYHGTTFGALSITGITSLRTPFEPLTPGGSHVPNANSYRWPEDRDNLWAADQIEQVIEFRAQETVAAVILEPVQNGGGCFVPGRLLPARARDLRPPRSASDIRRGDLLVGPAGTTSAASATATRPTSSPPRRGSRRPTRPWAP